MIYLDANVVVAAVANSEVAEQVARLLRSREVFYLSRLADYETRKSVAGLGIAGGEERLNCLIRDKFSQGREWESPILHALKIARQFKARLAVDSADTLHVGWAMSIGAEIFASFDRDHGPRALALSVGLKLWPKPEPKDYEQMKRLKG
ncbi:MAG: PIN domain-containing protein [Verrucomicrobia bacterium]|nr:PIN domain-containing protein [Verrucomicrobiota bacterium]MDE3099182.1 PIN domain-containing protein [Verrucomicrobiota bacterium]